MARVFVVVYGAARFLGKNCGRRCGNKEYTNVNQCCLLPPGTQAASMSQGEEVAFAEEVEQRCYRSMLRYVRKVVGLVGNRWR